MQPKDEYRDEYIDGPIHFDNGREPLLVQMLPTGHGEPPRPPRREILLPALLFVATCLSTLYVGGFEYALPVMFILTAHELGHFFQALRYRVPASLPFFIPMPFSPVGTMGAVIGMQAHVGDRKALYDIGITGPLAGLVPALVCSVVGLQWSHVADLAEATMTGDDDSITFGSPLLFVLFKYFIFGPTADTQYIEMHPLAIAGWVGIFITGLNLIPIGQLDGGHILYALLRRRAHRVAMLLFFAAAVATAALQYWGWSVMLLLLYTTGVRHPPTADDNVPLGRGRVILGWLTLSFVLLGFTPQPFATGRP